MVSKVRTHLHVSVVNLLPAIYTKRNKSYTKNNVFIRSFNVHFNVDIFKLILLKFGHNMVDNISVVYVETNIITILYLILFVYI